MMTPAELRARLAAFATSAAQFAGPLIQNPATKNSAMQLIRASTSAAANHRAAGRGRTHTEFTARLGVALEEIDESQYWVQHLLACGHVDAPSTKPVLAEVSELVAILTASYQTAKANEEAGLFKPPRPSRSRRPRFPD